MTEPTRKDEAERTAEQKDVLALDKETVKDLGPRKQDGEQVRGGIMAPTAGCRAG